MKVGKPPKYTCVEDMESDIESYFQNCDANNIPYTIAGLASSLNEMCTETLRLYSHKDEYFATIKKAKQKCESSLVEQSLTGKVNPIVGMFLLKCNFGYKDKQDNHEDDKNININIQYPPDSK